MHARRAFTLIELLVVISIIALLIAILLPALGRARDLSKSLVCKSNLHSVGIGLATYANDYQDATPPRSYGGNLARNNWFTRLFPYTQYPSKGYFENGNSYLGIESIYRCRPELEPIVRNGWYKRRDGVDDLAGTTYVVNGHLQTDQGGWNVPGKPLTEIRRPSTTIYAVDGNRWDRWYISNNISLLSLEYYKVEYFYYHLGSAANTLWVDGHASSMTRDEFQNDLLFP